MTRTRHNFLKELNFYLRDLFHFLGLINNASRTEGSAAATGVLIQHGVPARLTHNHVCVRVDEHVLLVSKGCVAHSGARLRHLLFGYWMFGHEIR